MRSLDELHKLAFTKPKSFSYNDISLSHTSDEGGGVGEEIVIKQSDWRCRGH